MNCMQHNLLLFLMILEGKSEKKILGSGTTFVIQYLIGWMYLALPRKNGRIWSKFMRQETKLMLNLMLPF
jgi:hypothetical protein